MGKVGFIKNRVSLLVGFLGGLVLKVDLAGAIMKKGATSGFGFQVMLGGYLCVSGPCTLKLYCVTISKLD